MSHLIHLERHAAVAYVTLNRPELHNAFNAEVIAGLQAVCSGLAADRSVRVVVLRGNGPSFCAGADLNWMRASLEFSHAENLADATRLDAMFAALNGLPQAVVACVQGAAMGGGVGLLACCDLVIAEQGARFSFSEVRLGLIPAVIAQYVVPRIGAGHARALFVSGQRFDAQRALQIGLVHEVVAADELGAALDRAVQELLRCGPEAMRAAKALVSAVTTLPPEAAREYVINAIAAARTGTEGQEGLRAFLEKRPAGWLG